MRNKMRRRNKSDVMTAFRLQFQHHFRQSFVRDFVFLLLFPSLRDLIILAINTTQIAVAEKDISRAVCSRQNRFFAKMRRVTRNNRKSARITRGDFVVQAIVAAIFWTNRARFEKFFQLQDTIF